MREKRKTRCLYFFVVRRDQRIYCIDIEKEIDLDSTEVPHFDPNHKLVNLYYFCVVHDF